MPPIPFPFPISVGTDICKISRIHKIISGPRAVRFIRLILTDEERKTPRPYVTAVLSQYWKNISDPAVSENVKTRALRDSAQFLAGRFAAKEAAIKAHPHRNLTFHQIIVKGEIALGDHSYSDSDAGGAIPLLSTTTPGPRSGSSDAKPKPDVLLEKEALYAEAERKNHPLFISVTSPPVCIIKGDYEQGIEDQIAMVSISHDTDYATATCLGWFHQGMKSGNPTWSERRAVGREWSVEREGARRTVSSQGRLQEVFRPPPRPARQKQPEPRREEEEEEEEEDKQETKAVRAEREREKEINQAWNRELGPSSEAALKRRKKLWGEPEPQQSSAEKQDDEKKGFYESEDLWDEFKKLLEPEQQQEQDSKNGGHGKSGR